MNDLLVTCPATEFVVPRFPPETKTAQNRLAKVDDLLLKPCGAKPTIHCQTPAKRFGVPVCHSGRDHQLGKTTLSGTYTPAIGMFPGIEPLKSERRACFTPLGPNKTAHALCVKPSYAYLSEKDTPVVRQRP